MKYKRLVCAVFALMLVGTSVASTATVFADEPTEIEGAGEVVNTEEPEVVAPEAGEEEAPETPAANEEVKKEEAAEPAGTAKAALRAAPALTANNENLRAGEGNEGVAEPTAVYNYTMELSEGTISLGLGGVHNSDNWRCNVAPANGGLTCDTEGTYSYSWPTGTWTGGNVTATKPGVYTVTYQHRDNIGSNYRPRYVWTDRTTVTVAVYNLDVTAQENTILEPGEEFEYTINEANTFGNVVTTVTRDGEEIDATNGIDTSEEGEYRISIVNTSAAAAGYDERKEYYFYVIDAVEERMVVEQGTPIEIKGSARWAADFAHSDPSGKDFEADEEGTILVDTNELDLGVYRFAVAHTFETGERETVNSVTVVIYKITAAEGEYSEEDYAAAADTLKDLVEQYGEADGPGDMIKLITKIGEIFGATDEGAMAAGSFGMGVLSGNEIVTRAHVEELSEDEVSEALIAKIADLGAENVTYWDVTVWMEIETARGVFPLGQLHQLDNAITVAVVEVPDVEAGYTRTYYVVREHDGQIEVLTEGVDFVVVDGEVYIISDKFSTYAVAYNDTLIPVTYTVTAPDTGASTSENGSASASLSMAAVTVMAAVTLAGAAVIAKRK